MPLARQPGMTRTSSLLIATALTLLAGCTTERSATAPAPAPLTTGSAGTTAAPPPASAPGASVAQPAAPSSVESLALRVVELENRVAKLEEIVKSHGNAAPTNNAGGMSGSMHDDMMGSMHKPMGDKPMGDKPMGDKPMGDKPMGNKPMGMKKEHGSMSGSGSAAMGSMSGSATGSATPSGMSGMEDM